MTSLIKITLKPKGQLRLIRKLMSSDETLSMVHFQCLRWGRIYSLRKFFGRPTQYLNILTRTVYLFMHDVMKKFRIFEVSLLKLLGRQKNVLNTLRFSESRNITGHRFNIRGILSSSCYLSPAKVEIYQIQTVSGDFMQPNTYVECKVNPSASGIEHYLKMMKSDDKLEHLLLNDFYSDILPRHLVMFLLAAALKHGSDLRSIETYRIAGTNCYQFARKIMSL